MAKYDVTYSCGHSDTIQLYGPNKERTRKIEWLERDGLCPECYKAKMEQQAVKKSNEMGLPELVGSEKQVAWAKKIRLDMIDRLQDSTTGRAYGCPEKLEVLLNQFGKESVIAERISAAKEKGFTDEQIAEGLKGLMEIINRVEKLNTFKSTTSAKWIIDNRI
jgi:hypothetical protein